MSCKRGCRFGYLGTDEIPLAHGERLSEGRIGIHLEFMARVGERTSVRQCPCELDPREMSKDEILEARRRRRYPAHFSRS